MLADTPGQTGEYSFGRQLVTVAIEVGPHRIHVHDQAAQQPLAQLHGGPGEQADLGQRNPFGLPAAAIAFVLKQGENVKIGVVSFATDASIVQPPTTDHDMVIAAIDRLRLQRATAIGRAILTSLDAIVEADGGGEGDLPSAVLTQPQDPNAPQKPVKTAVPGAAKAPASIILLTDGQNNQFPPPLAILDQAISRGIRVYTVGVGTSAGAVLSLEGRSIRTSLDETTLKQIAQDTDAEYFLATSDADLKKVYENLSTQLVIRNEKTEVTALFTLVAAVLSVVAGGLSLLWFNRLP